MAGFETNATDKNLRAWLNAGPLDRGVGDGLTFVATAASAHKGNASWVLRYRFRGREKEKTLGRYLDLSLKDARELARKDRALLHQGVDIAAVSARKSSRPSTCTTSRAWRRSGTSATSSASTSIPKASSASSDATSSR